MKKRYWEAIGDPNLDDLKDWVAENVVSALEEFTNEAKAYITIREGKIVLVFSSFEKTENEDGIEDVFSKEFDLFELVMKFIDIHGRDEIQNSNAKMIAEALRVAESATPAQWDKIAD